MSIAPLAYQTRSTGTLGLVVIAALVLVVGVWASTTTISGAVIAQGEVRIVDGRGLVQHPDGGVVKSVFVQQGQLVPRNAPLLELDDEDLGSRLGILDEQIDELKVQSARLGAEARGDWRMVLPPSLQSRSKSDPSLSSLIDGQRRLFDLRYDAVTEAVKKLDEQRRQAIVEISGLVALEGSTREQVEFLDVALESAVALQSKGLAEASRVLELRRERARLVGAIGETGAAIAGRKGRLAEIEMNGLRVRSDRRLQAGNDLIRVNADLARLEAERDLVEVKRRRLVLRAPVEGIVDRFQLVRPGSVVRAAEPVLSIVPQTGTLSFVAQINADQVDSVYVGQPATARFSTFDASIAPTVEATVALISAEARIDERTGARYYSVELRTDANGASNLDPHDLLQGMPVEIFIRTGDRTPLSMIGRPFFDYMIHALRD